MNHKKWLFQTLISSLFILLVVSGFNFFIDPLWSFRHSHEFNDVQEAFDERQQKTNYITFHDFNYDSLLLGSSRSTYLNQNDFKNYNVYNYSVSSMSVQEYNDFIEYAKLLKGSEFKTIFIGLDFFATNEVRKIENPEIYINKTNEFLSRYKYLISITTFKHSIQNFISSFQNQYNPSFLRNYNRNNIANAVHEKPADVINNIEKTVIDYKKNVYGKTYKYNEDYLNILKELKVNNPNTEFIVYTTPVSAPVFEALIEEGRLNDYKRWLKDTVDVFDEVNHFMYSNSVTQDFSNYYDGHHYYPVVGTLIAHKITNHPNPDIPNDFGIILTKKNIKNYFIELD